MRPCAKCEIETPHIKIQRDVRPNGFKELELVKLLNSVHLECYVCGTPSPCLESVKFPVE